MQQYIGRLAVPNNWNVQKEDLVFAGLEQHFKEKKPLKIAECWSRDVGTGCRETVFCRFEGQSNNSHFIASHFTLLKHDKERKTEAVS